jgi:Superinfection immunity protein
VDSLSALAILWVGVVGYFLPALIANWRDTQHAGWIGFVNLCLGWTGIGWLVALIWALVEKPESKVRRKSTLR